MFPGKEALVVLEKLACNQPQIWPDSCDGGILLTPENASLQTVIHNACAELATIYKNKKSKWHLGVGWECFVPFEMEYGLYIGTIVSVSLSGPHKDGKKFFSINLNHHRQTANPFKETSNG